MYAYKEHRPREKRRAGRKVRASPKGLTPLKALSPILQRKGRFSVESTKTTNDGRYF